MEFLILGIVLSLVAELMGRNWNVQKNGDEFKEARDIRHPAEFPLRDT